MVLPRRLLTNQGEVLTNQESCMMEEPDAELESSTESLHPLGTFPEDVASL